MKVNHKLQLIAVFMGMLMLTACGGGSSTAPTPAAPNPAAPNPAAPNPAAPNPAAPNPAAPNPAAPSPLDGSWRTACQASTELTDYDEQQIFNFKGNKLTTIKTFYTRDTNNPQICKHSEEALRERINSDITLGATINIGTPAAHTKIDIRGTKIRLVAMNDTIQDLLNNASHTGNDSIYYGYGKEWLTGYWKDLSSIEAAKTNFKIYQSVLDIFQISEKMVDGTTHKVLKLGAQGGNVDSYGRPLALATSITAFMPKKTIETQTAQATGLIGKWKYNCRYSKGSLAAGQISTLDFMGNKLTTVISFYYNTSNAPLNCSRYPIYQVKIEADIVVGKVINKGAANEHTQIGIKTTNIKIKPQHAYYMRVTFNNEDLYVAAIKDIYGGYGQKDWRVDAWKDVSDIPNAIENLNIGTQVPDIFNISTVTTDKGSHKVLKIGDYKGNFDINGRAMSLEAKGAVFQPK